MNIIKYISPSTVIFTTLLFFILFLNIFFIIRPIEYFENNLWLGIPLGVLIPFGLLFLDRLHYRKINREKIQQFQATIHTVQDIIQKSSSRIQNIMLDMEEQNVSESLQKEMKDTFNENVELIQILSSLNHADLLKTYSKHLSMFLLKDKEK
ncbi:hypothetical protein C0389_00640 [bacterium]|nr:hypothetical protein [bacterium]